MISPLGAAPRSEARAQVLDVAPVWSGHPVGFALLTRGSNQFVAFYDTERRMTVAARTLDSTNWIFQRLPQTTGWDSHNYITMATDDSGHLHLSGNMHVHPLVYFRSRRPLDVSSFESVPQMIGTREKRCTYPKFLRGTSNELIFTYRDGSSGNGDQIFNRYDEKTQTWRRLLDEPLFSGEGLRNAYFVGPVRGPDGFFHICWVWRDTPDCASNHDLCYARSPDLVHWQKSNGEPLKVPIALSTAEIVDPVPAGGGIINGNTQLGFDTHRKPIISYHKFDARGKTQLYNGRLENGHWKIYQASDWDYRWEFSGGGTIQFEIRVGAVEVSAKDGLIQSVHHPKQGSGSWVLEETTLKLVRRVKPSNPFADFGRQLPPAPAGMQTRTSQDLGHSDEPGVRYILRWDTLPSNRDRSRPAPWPAPTMLRLCRLVAEKAEAPR